MGLGAGPTVGVVAGAGVTVGFGRIVGTRSVVWTDVNVGEEVDYTKLGGDCCAVLGLESGVEPGIVVVAGCVMPSVRLPGFR